MADLESFFAKKDKKKKSKKVEIVPDELLKKIELAQKEESVEVDTQGLVDNGYDSNNDLPQKVLTAIPNPFKLQDDEEWEEFEGDKEIDISNLKIQNLGEMEKERQEVVEQEELQKAVEESKSTMKWNITRMEESSEDEEEKPVEETVKAGEQDSNVPVNTDNKEESKAATTEPTATANKRYIPPALRAQGLGQSQDARSLSASSGPTLEKTSLKRNTMKNQKIDVNSTDQFPSLGVAVQNTTGRGLGLGQDASGSFTSVRKGARNVQENTPDQKGLSTSNKFSVLKSNRT